MALGIERHRLRPRCRGLPREQASGVVGLGSGHDGIDLASGRESAASSVANSRARNASSVCRRCDRAPVIECIRDILALASSRSTAGRMERTARRAPPKDVRDSRGRNLGI
jgi:hypothetical protein